jgi:UDP-GlcNAc:undecaprenyl-phosphate GlcNAc-1-phosphate transferase
MTLFLILLILLNLLIFLNFQKFTKFTNIYDIPDNKLKLHKKKVPVTGGIILAINFTVLFLFQIFFTNDFLSLKINQFNHKEILSTLFFIYVYFFLGLYDDKFQLSPNKKLLYSIAIILFVIFFNEKIIVEYISLSFYEKKIFFENYSNYFILFCIILLINALNFYDGINGQSSIIFLISFFYLFIKSDMNYFYSMTIFFILFFFQFNVRNKLFLGDSGIYLLGVILSICLVYEHNIQKNIIFVDEIFFLLLLPGIDLLRLTITRILKKQNPFFGDRNHIHHLLIEKFSLFEANLILFFIAILPLFLFSFMKFNFFIVLFIITNIYMFLIIKLKSNDKNNYFWKKK